MPSRLTTPWTSKWSTKELKVSAGAARQAIGLVSHHQSNANPSIFWKMPWNQANHQIICWQTNMLNTKKKQLEKNRRTYRKWWIPWMMIYCLLSTKRALYNRIYYCRVSRRSWLSQMLAIVNITLNCRAKSRSRRTCLRWSKCQNRQQGKLSTRRSFLLTVIRRLVSQLGATMCFSNRTIQKEM